MKILERLMFFVVGGLIGVICAATLLGTIVMLISLLGYLLALNIPPDNLIVGIMLSAAFIGGGMATLQ